MQFASEATCLLIQKRTEMTGADDVDGMQFLCAPYHSQMTWTYLKFFLFVFL